MSSALRVIVTGLIAQHCRMGGVAWDYLNVLLGLSGLGHDVYYFEDSGEWPYRLDGTVGADALTVDCSENLTTLDAVMSRFGFADRWAYRFPRDAAWFGMPAERRRAIVQSADLLINVSGTLENPERYRAVERLVYVDTDPVFTQIRLARGDAELCGRVDAHDVHFTVGERLGAGVPDTGHDWLPTKHPIALSQWRTPTPFRPAFTTVMSWTSYEPLRFGGVSYGQKDIELRRFLDLPCRVGGHLLELALGTTRHVEWETRGEALPPALARRGAELPEPGADELLRRAGWQVVDASEACGDFDAYRRYIQSSMAEWSVAKNGYIAGPSGWFSGRSACYLAAGRPVVVQDTGFGSVLPLGEGVLAFRTPDEAVAAIREVERDHARHARAAREIAAEYFDSSRVLARMIDRAGRTGGGPASAARARERAGS